MEEIKVVVDIPGDPERVWAEISDHAGFKRFFGVLDSRVEKPGTPEPNGLGAIRIINTGLMQLKEEITAFDPPRRYEYLIRECNLPLEHHFGSVELEPIEGGARVVWISHITVPLPLLSGPATFMAKQAATMGFTNILNGIKAIVARG